MEGELEENIEKIDNIIDRLKREEKIKSGEIKGREIRKKEEIGVG